MNTHPFNPPHQHIHQHTPHEPIFLLSHQPPLLLTIRSGWNKSHVGWFWGGMTVQGILPYYYNMVASPGTVLSVSIYATDCHPNLLHLLTNRSQYED